MGWTEAGDASEQTDEFVPRAFLFRSSIPARESAGGKGMAGTHPFRIPCRLLPAAGVVHCFENCFPGGGVGDPTETRRTSTGLRQAKPGEQPGSVPGVLVAYGETVEALQGNGTATNAPVFLQYLLAVPVEQIEPCSWQQIPAGVRTVHVMMSVPHFMIGSPHDFGRPLLQSFVDMQLKDFITEYGEQFAIEWIESCRGWPVAWLNDRQIARRPWLHQPQYKVFDRLLAAHPPAPHNMFSHRALDIEFAAKAALAGLQPEPDLLPSEPLVADFRGSKLPIHEVQDFVFGFGSLINSKSRMSSDPKAADAVPVRVQFEFGRAWNFQSPTAQLTALGLERLAEGEQRPINGVISPVFEAAGMAALDEREQGYARVQIPVEAITATSWIALPDSIVQGQTTVWVYVPVGDGQTEPGVGLQMASYQYPILQTYIDVCLLGCLEQGEACAAEFIRSTRGWEGPWLDDRQTPRRPWIHQPQYKLIDKILRDVIPEQFKQRMLPEDMGTALAKQSLEQAEPKPASSLADCCKLRMSERNFWFDDANSRSHEW